MSFATSDRAGTRDTPGARKPARAALARRLRLFALIAILPVMVVFIYLRVIPIGQTVVMSFFDWELVRPAENFVGLDNYVDLLGDANFQLAMVNTLSFSALVTLFSVVIALVIAIPLSNATRGKWRAPLEILFFAPLLLPMVPVVIGWRTLLAYPDGVLNNVIGWFGVPPVPWLSDPQMALLAVVIISVWKQVGYNMILFTVGIRAIPPMYIEAARLDGANAFQVAWHILLPLIKPITLFVTVITTIGAFNVFTQVYVFASDTQGSPGWLVRVLVYDIFENGFRFFRMGYASAEAVYLLLIVLALTALQFKIAKERA